jgi:uncharacterized tellurite resistance protein B-like protein
MSFLAFLGFGSSESPRGRKKETPGRDAETIRKIVGALEEMPRDRARYLAAFAYILSRVAHADLEISEEETRKMESILQEVGGLPEEQAVLVVQIAKSQALLFAGTEDFVVTRAFKEMTTPEQRRQLLDCLFAVSAADASVSTVEEEEIRRIASQLDLTHRDYVEVRSRYARYRDVLRDLPEG